MPILRFDVPNLPSIGLATSDVPETLSELLSILIITKKQAYTENFIDYF